MDHGKVTLSIPAKEPENAKSLTLTVLGTEKFIKHYNLQKDASKQTIHVKIEEEYWSQSKNLYTNSPTLIKAVKSQDDSDVKTVFP